MAGRASAVTQLMKTTSGAPLAATGSAVSCKAAMTTLWRCCENSLATWASRTADTIDKLPVQLLGDVLPVSPSQWFRLRHGRGASEAGCICVGLARWLHSVLSVLPVRCLIVACASRFPAVYLQEHCQARIALSDCKCFAPPSEVPLSRCPAHQSVSHVYLMAGVRLWVAIEVAGPPGNFRSCSYSVADDIEVNPH
jgi:hypothetical protein